MDWFEMKDRYRDIVKCQHTSILEDYFKNTDFSIGAFSEHDLGSIESVLNHIVSCLELPKQYHAVKTNKHSNRERLWLRSYMSHKLAEMCKNKKIRRLKYGIYRPF